MRKIISILLLITFTFAENNSTIDNARALAKEAYNNGDIDASIKYLLLAEKFGDDDSFLNLCWICKNDKDNNLTKKWCSENDCQL